MCKHLVALLIALAAVYSPGSALLAALAHGRTPSALAAGAEGRSAFQAVSR
jgi:hypothetical protein